MARTCRGQYATTSKPPTHTLLLHPTDDDDDDDPNSPHHYEEPDFPTHPTESSTALHHTPHNPDLPPVLWIHENHRLVWKLLKLLEASPDLRRGIWRKPGERSHGETKINIFRQLARLLLQDEIGFPDKELEGHYGKAVKAKVWNLEVLFEKKVQEMGPERVDRVEDLVPGSLAEGAWGEFFFARPVVLVVVVVADGG